jgi:hypothetical protein
VRGGDVGFALLGWPAIKGSFPVAVKGNSIVAGSESLHPFAGLHSGAICARNRETSQ